MWGIATGTGMGLHRLRMGSTGFFAGNVAFATTMVVAAPSYYFCFRRREHHEKVIEMMMRTNDFQSHEDMPKTVPIKEHPFMEKGGEESRAQGKEYTAMLKERKEWEKALPMEKRDPSKVFQEVKKG